LLAAFIATAQQDDDRVASVVKIDAAAGTVMDTQLANPTGSTSPTWPKPRRSKRETLSSCVPVRP